MNAQGPSGRPNELPLLPMHFAVQGRVFDRQEDVLLPAAPTIAVPAAEELAVMRQTAQRDGSLKDVRQVVAAWEAVAAKCELAFEELVRLAVFRLEVERDLGTQLAQTVRHGGDRSRSPRVTLLPGALPQGITKQQAAKYRALAAIPDAEFQAYLQQSRNEHRVPTSSGARRCVVQRSSRSPRAHSPSVAGTLQPELPATALDAIGRIMTPDVCVGDLELPAKRRISYETPNALGHLAGDVVIGVCPDPDAWLPALQRLRQKAKLVQALVVLPATVWADWFRLLGDDAWSACFLTGVRSADGVGVLVAHHGARSSAFRVAFSSLGALM
jgi:hypothetical protein